MLTSCVLTEHVNMKIRYVQQYLTGILFVTIFHQYALEDDVNSQEPELRMVYYQSERTFWDAAHYCTSYIGGRSILAKDYKHFADVRNIVSTDEFWVAESIYSYWIAIIGCFSNGIIEPVINNYVFTSDKMECYNECKGYSGADTFFAIQKTVCVCLKPLTEEYESLMVSPDKCDRQCGDGIGLCGSFDHLYFTVYKTIFPLHWSHGEFNNETDDGILPQHYSTMGYKRECLARNCYINESLAYSCNERLDAICDGDNETKYMSWTRSLMSCNENYGQHFHLACSKAHDRYLWLPAFRGTIPDTNIDPADTEVAVPLTCSFDKYTDRRYCNRAPDDHRKLPFVCLEYLADMTDSPYRNHNTDRETTEKPTPPYNVVSMAIGTAIGVTVIVCVIVAVGVWVYGRRKRRGNANKREESIYEIPDRIPKSRDSHVYTAPSAQYHHHYNDIQDPQKANVPSPAISIYYTGTAPPEVFQYEKPVQSQTAPYQNYRRGLPQIPSVK